jgi:hypothetical protein
MIFIIEEMGLEIPYSNDQIANLAQRKSRPAGFMQHVSKAEKTWLTGCAKSQVVYPLNRILFTVNHTTIQVQGALVRLYRH